MEIKNDDMENDFSKRFKDRVILSNNISRQTGTPLFVKEQITEHPDVLVKMLRCILVDNAISVEEFSNKFRIYALEVLRMHPTKINTQKRNILVAMQQEHITWKRFVEIVVHILGFAIHDFPIELITDKGEYKKYSLTKL